MFVTKVEAKSDHSFFKEDDIYINRRFMKSNVQIEGDVSKMMFTTKISDYN